MMPLPLIIPHTREETPSMIGPAGQINWRRLALVLAGALSPKTPLHREWMSVNPARILGSQRGPGSGSPADWRWWI